jgi:hypothetical protein
MSNYATAAAEVGDKYLASLAEGQDRIIEYIRASRDFVPAMMLNEVPKSAFTPFRIPTIREMAELQFSFANKLLEQQRKFFLSLYATSPAKRTSGPASPPKAAPTAKARRSSASRTAKKASSKTAPSTGATGSN